MKIGVLDNPYAGVVTYADGILARGISINNNPPDDEGAVLATISEASADTGPVGGMVIAEWPAGATLEHSGGAGTDVLAGHRLVFLTGAREARGIISHTAGLYDLYADGEQMFFNAVKYMIPVVPVDPGTDGLVAHYAFENDTTDSSGNGLDGVVVGAPVFVDGVEGMALDFDGESYVDCGNDASLDITGPISMSIWIKPGTDGSVETAPLCKADAIAGWSWQLRYGWNTDKPTVMGFQFNSTGSRVWVYVNQDALIKCSFLNLALL